MKYVQSCPNFFNLPLGRLLERTPRIPMKWQLIAAGFCIAILVLGLSSIKPYVEIILDILLIPCIIFGCYFAYNVLVIWEESRKTLEEEEDKK